MTTPETIDAIEDLARRAIAADDADLETLGTDNSVLIRTVRHDESLQQVDLEQYLKTPRRNRGTVTIHEPADFAAYCNRLSDEHTTVWGHEPDRKFTAVFNDHADAFLSGWRDHTAVLQLLADPDWTTWCGSDGKLMQQAAFAEHLEDQAHTVVSPDAATMLEVAQTFQARRASSFSQGTKLSSGDVQLTWHEETDAKAGNKGHLEVPAEFTIKVAPFIGAAPVLMTARLRYRLNGGQLAIGFKLHRPDIVRRDAFHAVAADIAAELADVERTPMLLGHPPRL